MKTNKEEKWTMKLFNKAEIRKFSESLKNQPSIVKTGKFTQSMKNRMGIGSPERNATDTYERGMKIIPECISANENEIPVKQYNVAVLRNLLKFERAEGRMQVTNKRVVFRAAGRSIGGRTTVQHEFAIDEIAGIEARQNYKFSFLYLVFAILIVWAVSFIIYGPSVVRPSINSMAGRFSGIMFPKHVQAAYANEQSAISQKMEAEENIPAFTEAVESAKEAEEKAAIDAKEGIQKTRRVATGTTWWGETTYRNQTYRDTSPEGLQEAKAILDTAIAEREKAEAEEQEAIAQFESAKENETKAIKKRVNAVNTWKVFMTVLGLILGFGGATPFFVFYKKFGLKLFLLNFSIFGFALSLTATGFRFFNVLMWLSILTALVCVFLFCFRPNLIISIKNKGGIEAAVDIRRDTLFTRQNEKGTGFSEIIPTEETESAIREIGAMIGDIQKLGDLGLEKWVK